MRHFFSIAVLSAVALCAAPALAYTLPGNTSVNGGTLLATDLIVPNGLTLTVTNGGTVTDTTYGINNGTANISGSGSNWTNQTQLSSSGTLYVAAGGTVSDATGVNSGTANISGSGSNWTNQSQFNNSGAVYVTAGGTVSDATGVNSGTANISGSGSNWTNQSQFNSSATLYVTAGGTVSDPIGVNSGTAGISGSGSNWTNQSQFSSSATLYVTAGGTLSTGYGFNNGTIAVNGSGSSYTANSIVGLNYYNGVAYSLWVGGGAGTGAQGLLYVGGGAAVTSWQNAVVDANATTSGDPSVVEVDVGNGSSLTVYSAGAGNGLGTLTNNGVVRVVAGADVPAGSSSYTPINAATWNGTGTVQPVGGTWNGASHALAASNTVAGALGSATSMDTSVNQRALWTDSYGDTLGASFLAATSSTLIGPVVTALSSPASGLTLASNQYVLGDWGLSGVSTSNSSPVYLSLSADNPNYSDYELWAYSTASASWSEIVAPSATAPAGSTIANDLSFDGTSYGFSLTGATANGGGGLDFGGFDYVIVGTGTGPPVVVHHPGQVITSDPVVDINDLTIVLTNFGQTGDGWSQGVMDGDPRGVVDINDLSIVLSNFGTTYGASGISGAVPEPASLLLLAAGLAALLAWGWRKRK
jgi:hypothetical protein